MGRGAIGAKAAFSPDAINMLFQGTPTREAMLSSKLQLSIEETRFWGLRAQIVQPALGALAQ